MFVTTLFCFVFFSDPWTNIPNPCLNNPSKKIYFPHPSDIKKFIQCDLLSRMYIVQCPTGETYDFTTSSCSNGNSQPPISTTPTPLPTTTQAPNPCTSANIAQGNIYFPFPTDPTKFIQCAPNGLPQLGSCNPGMIWNQQRLACVFNTQPTGSKTTTPKVIIITPPVNPFVKPSTPRVSVSSTTTPSGTTVNICKHKVTNLDELFHPHPDPHKFIQCDLWGEMYVSDCPPNEVWNDFSKTCSSPYMQLTTAAPIFG